MRVRFAVLLLALFLTACNSGFPREPGRYTIQPGSLTYDGREHHLLWVDGSGTLHHASGDDVRMVQDAETYLLVGNGSPVVHLQPDERVALQDRAGNHAGWWVPFLLGSTLGRGPGAGPQADDSRPAYRYPPAPPTRPGETIAGSQTTERPLPADRRPQPAPGTAAGQAGGTGGGNAATGKIAKPAAGQDGGTGAGDAATGKAPNPSPGQSGGSGVGGAAAGKQPALGGGSRSSTGRPPSSGGLRGFRGRR